MRLSPLLLGALACLPAASAHAQVSVTPRVYSYSFSNDNDDDDRPRLGINTGSTGSMRDTLGLLVTSVTAGGPADKAGIEEGNRIASVNGASLRLSREDVEDEGMSGIMTRRLIREMSKVKEGQDVELRVWANGAYKTVKVRPVLAEDLPNERRRVSRDDMEDRAVVGLNLGGGASRRDTLGPLVVRVEEGGPAEKAGIVEGDRIAAINGVSLRVAREDAGDDFSSSIKVRRFSREMEKLTAGQNVTLQVVTDGRTRNVEIKTVRARDIYRSRGRGIWTTGGEFMPMVMPMTPRPPVAPRAPRVRIDMPEFRARLESQLDGARMTETIQRAMERAGSALRMLPQAFDQMLDIDIDGDVQADVDHDTRDDQGVARLRRQMHDNRAKSRATTPAIAPTPRATYRTTSLMPALAPVATTAAQYTPTEFVAPGSRSMSASASGERYSIMLPGLELAKVNRDLASYFGAGSENGLLVLRAGGRFSSLHQGDVLLSVDGQPVRDGDDASVSVPRQAVRAEILRAGKRVTVTI